MNISFGHFGACLRFQVVLWRGPCILLALSRSHLAQLQSSCPCCLHFLHLVVNEEAFVLAKCQYRLRFWSVVLSSRGLRITNTNTSIKLRTQQLLTLSEYRTNVMLSKVSSGRLRMQSREVSVLPWRPFRPCGVAPRPPAELR